MSRLPFAKNTGPKGTSRVRPGAARSLSLPRVNVRVLLLAVLVLVSAWFVPRQLLGGWLETAQAEVAATQASAQLLRDGSARVDAAAQQRAAVDEALAVAQAAVPDDPGLADVISDVDEVIAASGMSWASGSPAVVAASATPASSGGLVSTAGGAGWSWAMSMTLVGPLDRLPGTLDALSSLPRLVTLSAVTVQQYDDDDVSVTIEARFYAMDQDAPQGQEGVLLQ